MLCDRERFGLEALKVWLVSASIAYDVGANEGLISNFMARQCHGGKVFSFEPVLENLEVLGSNAMLNGCASRIVPVAKAVSNENGFSRFHRGPSPSEGHLEEAEFGSIDSSPVEVPTIKLDHFVYCLGNPSPNLIKIDAEGAGALVLRGSSRLLCVERPAFVIELHSHKECKEIGEIMAMNGYACSTPRYEPWDGRTFFRFIACWPKGSIRPLI
jgi:FkbM family methyltransferase